MISIKAKLPKKVIFGPCKTIFFVKVCQMSKLLDLEIFYSPKSQMAKKISSCDLNFVSSRAFVIASHEDAFLENDDPQ